MKQTSTQRLRRAWIAVLAATGALLVPPGASAEPPRSSITAVFDTARCASLPCQPGRDTPLDEGATVAGSVQIHVSSEATFGLEWVRLEAHLDGRPAQEWVCLELWRTPPGTFEFSDSVTWKTARWPDPPSESSCEETAVHFHGGKPSRNGGYQLRAIARERSPEREIEADAPRFAVKLANPATPPEWAQEPRVTGGESGDPAVVLRWHPSPEEATHPPQKPVVDIVEYHFVRIGPDGSQAEFAVSAEDPTEQGCRRLSGIYQCTDDSFPSGYGGDYRYALLAYRPGNGGVPCATAQGSCVESSLSTPAVVAVAGDPRAGAGSGSGTGAPEPAGSPDGTTGPTAQPTTDVPGQDDEPLAVAPARDRLQQFAAADATDPDKTIPVVVAAALIFGLMIAQARRVRGGAS